MKPGLLVCVCTCICYEIDLFTLNCKGSKPALMSTHCLRILSLFARCHHQKLKWDELAARKIAAPFKPKIKNEMDTSNFSDEFTTMVPADSPAVVPLDGEKIFKVRAFVLLLPSAETMSDPLLGSCLEYCMALIAK